jgi:hypothetical protein
MSNNKWPIYTLFLQVDPEPVAPIYRILETVLTADGPRTRVVDGVWSDSADAMKQRLDDLRNKA